MVATIVAELTGGECAVASGRRHTSKVCNRTYFVSLPSFPLLVAPLRLPEMWRFAVGLGLLAMGMATPTAPVVTPGRNGHAGTACPKLTLLGYTPVLRGPNQGSCSAGVLARTSSGRRG